MAAAGADFSRALMEALRTERDAQGVTMFQLAEASGLFEGTLRRYLNEHRAMPVAVFYDIATALGVDPLMLFARAEDRLTGSSKAMSERTTLRFDSREEQDGRVDVGRRIALLVEVLARGRGSRHGYREIAPLLLERGIRFSEDEWAALLEGKAAVSPGEEALIKIAEVLGADPAFLLGAVDDPDVVRVDAQLQFLREVHAGRVDGISARTTTDVTPETLRTITGHLRDGAPQQE